MKENELRSKNNRSRQELLMPNQVTMISKVQRSQNTNKKDMKSNHIDKLQAVQHADSITFKEAPQKYRQEKDMKKLQKKNKNININKKKNDNNKYPNSNSIVGLKSIQSLSQTTITHLPSHIYQLQQKTLNLYLKQFMQISSFQSIQKGKQLLELIKQVPQSKQSLSALNKLFKLFKSNLPQAVLCSFQFMRQMIQIGDYKIIKSIQQALLMPMVEIIEYRSYIPNMERGNSYFLNSFYRYSFDQKVNHLLRIGSTFFKMVHEAMYVWGFVYFPESNFNKMANKLLLSSKICFPKYPDEFKFYSKARIELFLTLRENKKQKQVLNIDNKVQQLQKYQGKQKKIGPQQHSVNDKEKTSSNEMLKQVSKKQSKQISTKETEKIIFRHIKQNQSALSQKSLKSATVGRQSEKKLKQKQQKNISASKQKEKHVIERVYNKQQQKPFDYQDRRQQQQQQKKKKLLEEHRRQKPVKMKEKKERQGKLTGINRGNMDKEEKEGDNKRQGNIKKNKSSGVSVKEAVEVMMEVEIIGAESYYQPKGSKQSKFIQSVQRYQQQQEQQQQQQYDQKQQQQSIGLLPLQSQLSKMDKQKNKQIDKKEELRESLKLNLSQLKGFNIVESNNELKIGKQKHNGEQQFQPQTSKRQKQEGHHQKFTSIIQKQQLRQQYQHQQHTFRPSYYGSHQQHQHQQNHKQRQLPNRNKYTHHLQQPSYSQQQPIQLTSRSQQPSLSSYRYTNQLSTERERFDYPVAGQQSIAREQKQEQHNKYSNKNQGNLQNNNIVLVELIKSKLRNMKMQLIEEQRHDLGSTKKHKYEKQVSQQHEQPYQHHVRFQMDENYPEQILKNHQRQSGNQENYQDNPKHLNKLNDKQQEKQPFSGRFRIKPQQVQLEPSQQAMQLIMRKHSNGKKLRAISKRKRQSLTQDLIVNLDLNQQKHRHFVVDTDYKKDGHSIGKKDENKNNSLNDKQNTLVDHGVNTDYQPAQEKQQQESLTQQKIYQQLTQLKQRLNNITNQVSQHIKPNQSSSTNSKRQNAFFLEKTDGKQSENKTPPYARNKNQLKMQQQSQQQQNQQESHHLRFSSNKSMSNTLKKRSTSKLSQRRSSLQSSLILKAIIRPESIHHQLQQIFGASNTLLFNAALNSVKKKRTSVMFC